MPLPPSPLPLELPTPTHPTPCTWSRSLNMVSLVLSGRDWFSSRDLITLILQEAFVITCLIPPRDLVTLGWLYHRQIKTFDVFCLSDISFVNKLRPIFHICHHVHNGGLEAPMRGGEKLGMWGAPLKQWSKSVLISKATPTIFSSWRGFPINNNYTYYCIISQQFSALNVKNVKLVS